MHRVAVLQVFIDRDQAVPDEQAQILGRSNLVSLALGHVLEGSDHAVIQQDVPATG